MKHYENYERAYFMPPECTYDWVKKEYLTKAPIWCSVDLRDGNQALVEPMCLEEKIQFFQMLVKIGFKQIEVGFPAASETEYDFIRTLIEQDMIPEDVTIQVLTQAREHIIRKTFEAIEGAQNVIVHLYLSTSVAQREQVFHKSKEEIIKTAVDGAIMVKELADKPAPEPKSITQSKSAMRYLISGSRHRIIKPLSTFRLPWKIPYRMCLPHRLNTFTNI